MPNEAGLNDRLGFNSIFCGLKVLNFSSSKFILGTLKSCELPVQSAFFAEKRTHLNPKHFVYLYGVSAGNLQQSLAF
jgi:hypothetical protein